MKEYDWLKESLEEFSTIAPDLLTKASFHAPTIIPLPPKINIKENLSTEIDGLFVAGECAGKIGILSAAMMGIVAADSVCE
jgi:uncharacterized FAD-dependent dehydrogenase